MMMIVMIMHEMTKERINTLQDARMSAKAVVAVAVSKLHVVNL
jgi:hypothetical protein